jgi:hypothetical protein
VIIELFKLADGPQMFYLTNQRGGDRQDNPKWQNPAQGRNMVGHDFVPSMLRRWLAARRCHLRCLMPGTMYRAISDNFLKSLKSPVLLISPAQLSAA